MNSLSSFLISLALCFVVSVDVCADVPSLMGEFPSSSYVYGDGMRVFHPDDLSRAVEREGLLPLVAVAPGVLDSEDLLAISSHGYVVGVGRCVSDVLDGISLLNSDGDCALCGCVDIDYSAVVSGSCGLSGYDDRRLSTRVLLPDGVLNDGVCSLGCYGSPDLVVCPLASFDSVGRAFDAAGPSAVAVAYAECPDGAERLQLLLDWLGWQFKGQSNRRGVFVCSDLRGYSDSWRVVSKNFLSDFEFVSSADGGGFRFEFDSSYPDVHDPVLAWEDGVCYMFTTGFGIGLLSSADGMRSWRRERAPLDPIPQWATDKIVAYKGHTWAPDIVRHGDSWYLYYSCSTFGKNISAIGVMSSPFLDPERAQWTDLGMVVESVPGLTDWNAIDPNVAFDGEGNPWLAFGSFWDGIQLVRLSDDMRTPIGEPVTVARRRCACKVAHLQERANTNAIEAPFILCHDGMYYLFVSYDYCCQGLASTYKTAVGRSERIEGPYLDRDGVDMAETGGSIIVAETSSFAGVGHCGVYDHDGVTYFVAHAYDKALNGRSKLFLRKIEWIDGWPSIVF